MRARVLNETPGRVHLNFEQGRISPEQADQIVYYFREGGLTDSVRVFERTGDVLLKYLPENRDRLFDEVRAFSYELPELQGLEEDQARRLSVKYRDRLISKVAMRYIGRYLFPAPVGTVITIIRSWKYLKKGMKSLMKMKLSVDVLDGLSIGISLLQKDSGTASSLMFMLGIGDLLEEWTYQKSLHNLAESLSLGVDKVWLIEEEGQERLVPTQEVKVGDKIRVQKSGMIALDGIVTEGEAMVNQASLTGESVPVRKTIDNPVYAGTVVEEGEIVLEVRKAHGQGRYDRILDMLEESQGFQTQTSLNAIKLADRLVPYTLGISALTYVLTRDVTKAITLLMVDFSCALKLAMPLAILSAMTEAGRHEIIVKNGAALENLAGAETILFDKTGTLTKSQPALIETVRLDDLNQEQILKIAACLEEHFPHPMANAVVKAAQDQGINHQEVHSKPDYIVAHGIKSTIQGTPVYIGSDHFIREDIGIEPDAAQQKLIDELPEGFSYLYLAVGDRLKAVLCIQDPLREEAFDVIAELGRLGIARKVMLTGDSDKTAKSIAAQAGLDHYVAEVLPEDKAYFVEEEQKDGRKVIMIGDGVNDAPALGQADVGVSVSEGAAIAREVADLLLASGNLEDLVKARKLADALDARLKGNFRKIVGINAAIMAFGAFGVLTPSMTSLFHNTSTIIIALLSMTPLLGEEKVLYGAVRPELPQTQN